VNQVVVVTILNVNVALVYDWLTFEPYRILLGGCLSPLPTAAFRHDSDYLVVSPFDTGLITKPMWPYLIISHLDDLCGWEYGTRNPVSMFLRHGSAVRFRAIPVRHSPQGVQESLFGAVSGFMKRIMLLSAGRAAALGLFITIGGAVVV